jgi:hypothetical protein
MKDRQIKNVWFYYMLLISAANTSNVYGKNIGVEKIDFCGWKDCYILRNESVELTIVPQIGRAVSFKRADSSNVLNIFEDALGKKREIAGSYVAFGGFYTWLAPQFAWRLTKEQVQAGLDGMAGAPMDGLPHTITKIGPRSVTISMTDKANYKIAIEKTFALKDANLPKLLYSVKCKNVGNQTVRWSIWNISAVAKKGKVLFSAPNGLADLRFACNGRNSTDELSRFVHFQNPAAMLDMEKLSDQKGKYFVRPYGTYLMHCMQDYWFVRSFSLSNTSSEILFTDNNSQVEIWVDTSTGLYELEVLSPEFCLKPGDECVWNEELWIIKSAEEKKLLNFESREIDAINKLINQ